MVRDYYTELCIVALVELALIHRLFFSAFDPMRASHHGSQQSQISPQSQRRSHSAFLVPCDIFENLFVQARKSRTGTRQCRAGKLINPLSLHQARSFPVTLATLGRQAEAQPVAQASQRRIARACGGAACRNASRGRYSFFVNWIGEEEGVLITCCEAINLFQNVSRKILHPNRIILLIWESKLKF